LLREPFIKIYPLKDLYLSPLEIQNPDQEQSQNTLDIGKGETKQFGGYSIQFAGFDMSQHGQQAISTVGAVLKITKDGKEYEVIPRLGYNERQEPQYIPADLPTGQYPDRASGGPQIIFTRMSVETKRVLLSVTGLEGQGAASPTPQLLLEASIKPLMMVVWTGVVLIVGGTLLAYRRRISEKVEKN